MDLAGIFRDVAQQMRSDLERTRKSLTHSGLKGESFETIFRSFLRAYLPRSLDIFSGQVVDSKGGVSRQLDVIIADAAKTPLFFQSEANRVVPVEPVYAVIEIKAHLDRQELDKAFANMQSVRSLVKSAYYPQQLIIDKKNMYGKEWQIWPCMYFLFSFDSIDLIQLAQAIYDHVERENLPPENRIDMVCVLDKGVVLNLGPDGMFDALAVPGSQLKAYATQNALLLFTR